MFVQFTSNASAIFLTYTVRDSNLTSFSNFSPIGEEPTCLHRVGAMRHADRLTRRL